MLIVRAPTRISLGGGGTDLEAYYALKGGLVVSAAINRYCYVVIQAADNDEVEIVGSNYHNLTIEPSVNSLPWNQPGPTPRRGSPLPPAPRPASLLRLGGSARHRPGLFE